MLEGRTSAGKPMQPAIGLDSAPVLWRAEPHPQALQRRRERFLRLAGQFTPAEAKDAIVTLADFLDSDETGNAIEFLIGRLDARDGDSDVELNGDELDSSEEDTDISWPEGQVGRLALMRGGVMHDDAEADGDEADGAWTEWSEHSGAGRFTAISHWKTMRTRTTAGDYSDAEDTAPESGDGPQGLWGSGLAVRDDDHEPDTYCSREWRDRVRRQRTSPTLRGIKPRKLHRPHVSLNGRIYF